MNQILFYGGFGLSGMMFFLSLLLWKRGHIWKTWRDVATYRSQKLGTHTRVKRNGDKTITTTPLTSTNLTEVSAREQEILAEVGEKTALLSAKEDGNDWVIIDEVLFIHTNEV